VPSASALPDEELPLGVAVVRLNEMVLATELTWFALS